MLLRLPIGPRHPCAVCPRLLRTGYLMCLEHWQLVPLEEQRQVNRTWAVSKRTHGRSGYAACVHLEYADARQRAIQSARAAMEAADGLPARAAAPTRPATPATHREDATR